MGLFFMRLANYGSTGYEIKNCNNCSDCECRINCCLVSKIVEIFVMIVGLIVLMEIYCKKWTYWNDEINYFSLKIFYYETDSVRQWLIDLLILFLIVCLFVVWRTIVFWLHSHSWSFIWIIMILIWTWSNI